MTMMRRLLLLGGYRELILNFVVRDVKEKYRGTVLGYLWTLVTPLIMMGVFMVIFTYVFPVGIPRYPVYLLVALLAWNSFYACLSDCTWSIRTGGELLKRVYFPPEVLPLSSMIANLVALCLSLLVLVPFMVGYQIPFTARIWFLPGIVLWQAAFSYGLGLILALSYVYYRDTTHLMGAALNVWFYATPIFYNTDFMSEKVRMLYYLNPTAVMVDLYRWVFLGTARPTAFHLLVWGAVTVALLWLGVRLYARHASRVAKVL